MLVALAVWAIVIALLLCEVCMLMHFAAVSTGLAATVADFVDNIMLETVATTAPFIARTIMRSKQPMVVSW